MTSTSELIERLRRRTVPICGGAGVYDVVLGEKPDALCQEAADALELLSSSNDGVTDEMTAAGCEEANLIPAPSNRRLVARIYTAMHSVAGQEEGPNPS